MIETKCKKCGFRLALDIFHTAKKYNLDVDILINEDGKLALENLPDYYIFVCGKCGNTKKYSFEEVQLKFKTIVIETILNSRQQDSYMYLDSSKIQEENGISYCGMCLGPFDENGYCYNDIKLQCSVRKDYLKK